MTKPQHPDMPPEKNIWTTDIVKEDIEYSVVVRNYEIVEKEGKDQEVVNRKKFGFGEIHDKFSTTEDMVERNLVMEYCSLEGFFQQDQESATLSF